MFRLFSKHHMHLGKDGDVTGGGGGGFSLITTAAGSGSGSASSRSGAGVGARKGPCNIHEAAVINNRRIQEKEDLRLQNQDAGASSNTTAGKGKDEGTGKRKGKSKRSITNGTNAHTKRSSNHNTSISAAADAAAHNNGSSTNAMAAIDGTIGGIAAAAGSPHTSCRLDGIHGKWNRHHSVAESSTPPHEAGRHTLFSFTPQSLTLTKRREHVMQRLAQDG